MVTKPPPKPETPPPVPESAPAPVTEQTTSVTVKTSPAASPAPTNLKGALVKRVAGNASLVKRTTTVIATFGLTFATLMAVGGLLYDLVINGNAASAGHLTTLATLGFGGLLALSGGRHPNPED